MQDFCDKLVVLIGEAPDTQTGAELRRILSRCKNDGGNVTPQSGGGGGTNPTEPGKPPKPGSN